MNNSYDRDFEQCSTPFSFCARPTVSVADNTIKSPEARACHPQIADLAPGCELQKTR